MSFIRAGSLAYSRVGRVIVTKNTRFLSTTALRASQSEQSPIKVNPSEAPTTPHGESSLIQKETPSEAMARHQPDYDATIDHGTSYENPQPAHEIMTDTG
jgi:NADH dehydrogenase (ubiquinone) Fe-S protein 4